MLGEKRTSRMANLQNKHWRAVQSTLASEQRGNENRTRRKLCGNRDTADLNIPELFLTQILGREHSL